jgi:hypothetical protein
LTAARATAVALIALPLLAAACGGSKTAARETTTAAAPAPPSTTTVTFTATVGTAPVTVPACTSADLQATEKQGDAGVGNRSTVYVLTNAVQDPCRLYGYPGMAFVDAAGTTLRDTVARGSAYLFTDPGPAAVVLQPAESASFSLGWSVANGAVCATSATVEITPPNDTGHLTIPSQVVVCPGRPLTVSAVAPRAHGAS